MNSVAFKDLTRIEQVFFGLPFLLAGALLPLILVDLTFSFRWILILPAFILARFSGMAFNQLIDRHLDAKNSRTKMRPLPSKRVSERQAQTIACGTLFLFILICSQINARCFYLAPFAAFLLIIYSYLKRMTVLCHFVLGLIHFLGPLMASVAVSGEILLPMVFLSGAAACLISGSDIIYAIQDCAFDREAKLYSLPAKWGIEKSLFIARLSHLMCIVLLLCVGIFGHLPLFYYAVVLPVAMNFYKFHKKIADSYSESLFFTCNVMTSLTVCGFVLASVIWDSL